MVDRPDDRHPQRLKQAPNYHIVQVLLGHPHHLASLTELDYYIHTERILLQTHLKELAARDVLARYPAPDAASAETQPSALWGFTNTGIDILGDYHYLKATPVLRAIHDLTEKPAQVKHHEKAPRPSLPDAVAQTLMVYEVPDQQLILDEQPPIPEEPLVYADAVPDDPTELNEGTDGDRTLDELF